jgi:hypothetical protein
MSNTILCSCLLGIAALGFLGCGGESTPPPKTEAIGGQAKKQVQDFVAAAKKAPASAPDQLQMLKESLAAYAKDYGQEFEPVQQAATELEALYQKKAPKAEIDAQLQKLSDAANALPN